MRGRFAVDREPRSGKRGRTQGAFVHPRLRIGDPRAVTPEHFVIGHEVVAQCDGLRGLQVRETGHDAVRMLACAAHQRLLQGGEALVHLAKGIAHPQAEIGRDLIVAAARGVKAPCDRADQFGEPRLGGHVDVFAVPVLGHAICFVFCGDGIETRADRPGILGRDDPGLAQHRDMRLGRGDILPPQRLVERDRGVDFAHDRARAISEAAAPHRVGRWLVIGACHVARLAHSRIAAPAVGGMR